MRAMEMMMLSMKLIRAHSDPNLTYLAQPSPARNKATDMQGHTRFNVHPFLARRRRDRRLDYREQVRVDNNMSRIQFEILKCKGNLFCILSMHKELGAAGVKLRVEAT